MAAITISGQDIIAALFGDWEDIGKVATADSIGSTYVQDHSQFGDSNVSSQQHRGRYLIRPTQTYGNADFEKRILTVNNQNGRATIASVDAYAVTGTGETYWESTFAASTLLTAIQNALLAILERKTVGLGFGHDFDMMLANTSYWDGTLGGSSKTNANVEKVTTEGLVGVSEQALHVTGTGASPIVKGEPVRVWPGSSILIATINQVASGGVMPRYYDIENAAYLDIANDLAYAGGAQAYMERRFDVPAGCYHLQPQFGLSTNTSEFYVSQVFGPYAVGDRLFERLPSWVSERYNIELVRPAKFSNQLAGSTGVYAASTRTWCGDLVQPRDFQPEIQYRAASPAKLVFEDNRWVQEDIGHKPLYIQASRNAHVGEPFTDFDSTTTQPLLLVLPYVKRELATIAQGRSKDPIWVTRAGDGQNDASFEVIARQAPTKEVKRQGWKNIVG